MNCLCLSPLLCPVYEIRIHITSTDERILFSWTTNYCLDWGNASKIIEKNIQKKNSFLHTSSLTLWCWCSLDFSLCTTLPLHPSHTVHSTLYSVSGYTIGIWNLNSTRIFCIFLLFFCFVYSRSYSRSTNKIERSPKQPSNFARKKISEIFSNN